MSLIGTSTGLPEVSEASKNKTVFVEDLAPSEAAKAGVVTGTRVEIYVIFCVLA